MTVLVLFLAAVICVLMATLCKVYEINATLRHSIDHYEGLYLSEKAKAEFFEEEAKKLQRHSNNTTANKEEQDD